MITTWQRATIRVKNTDVMRNARTHQTAYSLPSIPGLAINRSTISDWLWSITHVPSGTAVLKAFETITEAAHHMRNIADVCDWTLSAAQISELPNLSAIVDRLNEELSTYTDFYRVHPTLSPGAADDQPRALTTEGK